MYKDIRNQIKSGEIKKAEKSFSEQEVINMIAKTLLNKSEEYKEVDMEILKKNWKKAFGNGLTILGMIQGAQMMSQPGTFDKPEFGREKGSQAYEASKSRVDKWSNKGSRSPSSSSSGQEQIKAARDAARADGQAIIDKHSKKSGNIDKFLNNISMVESSGGKNTNHKEMKGGIHSGDSAIGKYGLMPNTIKEMAGRMGKDHPLKGYSKMDNKSITESIKKNPDHEHGMAKFLANHLSDKFGGDENKMAFAYNQGHNMDNEHPKFISGEHEKHPYVQKFNQSKFATEKKISNPAQKVDITSN